MIRSLKTDIVTGNGVLDTILTRKNQYCAAHNINFTCLVGGKLLNFLETRDICSIFGNALDNTLNTWKSIRYTIEKYRGIMPLHTENNWFVMRILIPLAA